MALVDLDKLLDEQVGSARIIHVCSHVRSCFPSSVLGDLKRDLGQRLLDIILPVFSHVIIVVAEVLLQHTPVKLDASARNLWVPCISRTT